MALSFILIIPTCVHHRGSKRRGSNVQFLKGRAKRIVGCGQEPPHPDDRVCHHRGCDGVANGRQWGEHGAHPTLQQGTQREQYVCFGVYVVYRSLNIYSTVL